MTRPAGPIVTIGASCAACPHERRIVGPDRADAGMSECHEPVVVIRNSARPRTLRTDLVTEEWCPLLASAVARAWEASR